MEGIFHTRGQEFDVLKSNKLSQKVHSHLCNFLFHSNHGVIQWSYNIGRFNYNVGYYGTVGLNPGRGDSSTTAKCWCYEGSIFCLSSTNIMPDTSVKITHFYLCSIVNIYLKLLNKRFSISGLELNSLMLLCQIFILCSYRNIKKKKNLGHVKVR